MRPADHQRSRKRPRIAPGRPSLPSLAYQIATNGAALGKEGVNERSELRQHARRRARERQLARRSRRLQNNATKIGSDRNAILRAHTVHELPSASPCASPAAPGHRIKRHDDHEGERQDQQRRLHAALPPGRANRSTKPNLNAAIESARASSRTSASPWPASCPARPQPQPSTAKTRQCRH